jgi:hypothetical protein
MPKLLDMFVKRCLVSISLFVRKAFITKNNIFVTRFFCLRLFNLMFATIIICYKRRFAKAIMQL